MLGEKKTFSIPFDVMMNWIEIESLYILYSFLPTSIPSQAKPSEPVDYHINGNP